MVNYFSANNIELIAKIATLQLEMNKLYNQMQLVASEQFTTDLEINFNDEFKETYKTINENGVVILSSLKRYISLYDFFKGYKPSWAEETMKAARKFEKLKTQYESLLPEIEEIEGYSNPSKLTLKLFR